MNNVLKIGVVGVDYSSARDPPKKKPKLTCPHGLFIQEHVWTPKCCMNLAPSARRALPHLINLPEEVLEFPSNDTPMGVTLISFPTTFPRT